MECRGAGPRAGDGGVPRGLGTAEMDSARCSPFATFSLVRVEAAYDVLPLTGNATGFPPNQLSRPPRSKLASTGDARCKPSLTQLWSASASQESRSSRTTSRTARSSLLLSLGPSIIPSLGARCVRWVMEVEEGADGVLQLAMGCLYPQDSHGMPVRSDSGIYKARFLVNGAWRCVSRFSLLRS